MEFHAVSSSASATRLGDGCVDVEGAGGGGDATSEPGFQPLCAPRQLPRGSWPLPPPETTFQTVC